MAVKQCDFPEDVALVRDAEHKVAAIRREHADLHRTRENAHQSGAGVALGKDHSPTRQAPPFHVRA
jgi:hypothetical protein